jgi:hypothetical protein
MGEKPLSVRVDCYEGYMGEETPRCFYIGSRKIEVIEIIDRWLAPEHRYFKLIGDDDGMYIIRHDAFLKTWELTFYKSKAAQDQ